MIKNKALYFAMSHYFCEINESNYDKEYDKLTKNPVKTELTLWEPFENYPLETILEYIDIDVAVLDELYNNI